MDDVLRVGVPAQTEDGERRVALVPDAVGRLRAAGVAVLVEHGAGTAAFLPDEAYAAAGAEVVARDEVYRRADVMLYVGRPSADAVGRLRAGQTVIGLLRPLTDPAFAADLAARGVTAISLDGIPRTLSRAQSMDALTSQANVAGYKAALLAANVFGRYFPMLVTAAGTARPARVLVLGAGVAGLQALGTARRLGAVVAGYDVRPEARAEVESVGAAFLDLGPVGGAGEGGYARALTPEEQQAQQASLAEKIASYDIVITTAQVPGRRPPLLVTADAVKAMAPGSVVVDLAASDLGGNVELSQPERTVVTDNGVTVIGAGNLPATVPTAASTAYSRNLTALLTHLVHDGKLRIDLTDEIQAGVVVTHDGQVVHPATARVLESGGTRS
ncbi:MAG TPA: Re/Si-specific NAD(P)(+) transhydrogenase subunit alpha [Micromonosporaceae bacterium]